MRRDDIRTEVTIKGVISKNFTAPKEGETITYIGLKQVGWKYDHDRRGYAILHTAKPIEAKDDPREYKVESVTPTIYAGAFRQIAIKCYTLDPTTE